MMKKGSTLKPLYDDFMQLPFPKLKGNEYLSDWITSLAELDGFYAGLAESLLVNKPIRVKRFPSLKKLFKELERLHNEDHLSQKHYLECKNYLLALEKLATFVKQSERH